MRFPFVGFQTYCWGRGQVFRSPFFFFLFALLLFFFFFFTFCFFLIASFWAHNEMRIPIVYYEHRVLSFFLCLHSPCFEKLMMRM